MVFFFTSLSLFSLFPISIEVEASRTRFIKSRHPLLYKQSKVLSKVLFLLVLLLKYSSYSNMHYHDTCPMYFVVPDLARSLLPSTSPVFSIVTAVSRKPRVTSGH